MLHFPVLYIFRKRHQLRGCYPSNLTNPVNCNRPIRYVDHRRRSLPCLRPFRKINQISVTSNKCSLTAQSVSFPTGNFIVQFGGMCVSPFWKWEMTTIFEKKSEHDNSVERFEKACVFELKLTSGTIHSSTTRNYWWIHAFVKHLQIWNFRNHALSVGKKNEWHDSVQSMTKAITERISRLFFFSYWRL